MAAGLEPRLKIKKEVLIDRGISIYYGKTVLWTTYLYNENIQDGYLPVPIAWAQISHELHLRRDAINGISLQEIWMTSFNGTAPYTGKLYTRYIVVQ